MRWLALVAIGGGCGRFGFSPEPPGPDGRVLDGSIDSTAAVIPDATVCAASYTLVGGMSLFRLGAAATWTDAEASCEADGEGMHLAVIADFTEQQKIESFLAGARAWIGVSDRRTDNNFLHVIGGAETYLPWANNFPNVVGPGCVLLDPTARNYQDAACTLTLASVCECDRIPADPTSY